MRHPELEIRPVGFLDDDPHKAGMAVAGLRVLGTVRDVARVVRQIGVERVVITSAAFPAKVVGSIMDACAPLGVDVRIVRGTYETLGAGAADGPPALVREIRIEDLFVRGDPRANIPIFANDLAAAGSGAKPPRDGAPDVLLIVLESHGARHLRAFNPKLPDDPTPNLTRLLSRGVLFDRITTPYPESIKGLFAALRALQERSHLGGEGARVRVARSKA